MPSLSPRVETRGASAPGASLPDAPHVPFPWRLLLVFMLPLVALVVLVLSFRHLSATRAVNVGMLNDAHRVLTEATRVRAAAARLTVGDTLALSESERAITLLMLTVPDHSSVEELPGDGAEAEEPALLRGWTNVRRSAAALRGTNAELAGARGSSPLVPALTRRLDAESARLEASARALVRSAELYEREASAHDLDRIIVLTLLLLAAFALALTTLMRRTIELRRHEAQLAQLALVSEHATRAVAITDLAGCVLWVNREFKRATGWTQEDVLRQPLDQLLFVDPADFPLAELASAPSGRVLRRELRLRTRDGREIWGSLDVTPLPGPAAEPERRIVSFLDVTEARSARLALATSESRFRSALDAMAEGLVIQAPDGAIMACNRAAERILGLTQEQMSGRTSMDPRWRTTREDGSPLPGTEHPAMIALRTGEPVSDVTMGVHRPDGSHVWISVEANLIRDPESRQSTGVVTTFLDVTSRRRADADLRKLTQAIEQSPTACMITNAQRELEYVNRCFERITGWKAEDVIGRNPRLLASGQTPASTYAAMWASLERGERWQGELINHRRDGTPFRTRMVVFPLKDDNDAVTHYVALVEDITEEHRRARELVRAREEALAAARAKNEFLQNMSHELRTPMNGILGMAELLAQSDLSSAQRADLATLRTSADQLLTVISQLFDFTRLGDAGASARVAFHLRQALGPVRDKLSSGAEARGLKWAFDLAPQLPDSFLGDPGGLRQVLLHLVDNALKFTPRGEVRVRVSADHLNAGRWQVRFEVQDTGIGIPFERQGSIFEPFEQADGSSTRRYGGVGLGLTLARLIVSRLDGHLMVTSEPGGGSTFAFTVPLEPLPAAAAAAPGPAAATGAGMLAGARVVLVDGGGAMRGRALASLEAAGARLETVPGPEGAIALVREALPADPVRAIVLDERGGGFDAFPAAQRLAATLGEAQPPTLLVAVTGQRGDAERCRDFGIGAYLTHPVSDADLREALEQLVGESRKPAERAALLTRHVLRERRRAVRLLLVEDNAVNRKVATRLLERSGFVVQVAEDGHAGLERFREGGWDVVLMDMQMPVMDGLEATRAIRAYEAERGLARTPVIAVTAHTLDDDRAAAREAGMDGFVGKPISPDELLQVIHGLVQAAPEEVAAESGPPALAEVIDWAEALERMDGDEVVLGELLRLFLQDSDHMMQRLEEARASGDPKQLERAAHGLKGASATISARAVAALSREIETLAREGEHVQALDRLQELRVEMQRLRRALEAMPEAGGKAA